MHDTWRACLNLSLLASPTSMLMWPSYFFAMPHYILHCILSSLMNNFNVDATMLLLCIFYYTLSFTNEKIWCLCDKVSYLHRLNASCTAYYLHWWRTISIVRAWVILIVQAIVCKGECAISLSFELSAPVILSWGLVSTCPNRVGIVGWTWWIMLHLRSWGFTTWTVWQFRPYLTEDNLEERSKVMIVVASTSHGKFDNNTC
jgi:hypothetical protein